ncbi:membrane protein FAM174B isoform X1 [Nerophis lumbriciformis]|uniref:membrane protein FAM174B isoform X1 n=2 Tax=Nerophis lumbriciformis TaxID=546530 RepID=UPI002ADF1B9C|nr:membrane protein FAM174B-like isoform X1 [Nerophis lumbriciformis]
MATFYFALTFILVAAFWSVDGEPRTLSSPATPLNATSSAPVIHKDDRSDNDNATHAAVGTRISTLMTHLPTLKVVVILTCVLTAALITCLLVKVVRSGRRIRKTRKYDIITTPAERVEMAPLNDENDDEDDSTLFDVNYRFVLNK